MFENNFFLSLSVNNQADKETIINLVAKTGQAAQKHLINQR